MQDLRRTAWRRGRRRRCWPPLWRRLGPGELRVCDRVLRHDPTCPCRPEPTGSTNCRQVKAKGRRDSLCEVGVRGHSRIRQALDHHTSSEGDIVTRLFWPAQCLAVIGLLLAGSLPASAADGNCDQLDVCDIDDAAVVTGLLSRQQVLALPKHPKDKGGPVDTISESAPRYEYVSLNDCPQAKPESFTEQVSCAHALRDCP